MLKVAVLTSDEGGCGWYRLIQPLRRLERRGEVTLTARVTMRDGRRIPCILGSDWDAADVVLIQKAASDEILVELGRHGAKTVFEIDDDLDRITKDNPCHREEILPQPGLLTRMRRNARLCRLLTCTTPHLAGALKAWHGTRRVVPNGIDLDLWRPCVPRGDGQVRIGYLASRAHVEDARLVARPLRRICDDHPGVT
ncbi:MAG: hypothetical protein RJA59_1546, partial [Pseudomonadota bacterium]